MTESAKSARLRVTFAPDGKAIKAEHIDGTPVRYERADLTIVGARLASHYQAGDLAAANEAAESGAGPALVVEFAEDGTAVSALNEDNTQPARAPGQNVDMEGAQLRGYDTATAQTCCWKLIQGVWVCRPEFCA